MAIQTESCLYDSFKGIPFEELVSRLEVAGVAKDTVPCGRRYMLLDKATKCLVAFRRLGTPIQEDAWQRFDKAVAFIVNGLISENVDQLELTKKLYQIQNAASKTLKWLPKSVRPVEIILGQNRRAVVLSTTITNLEPDQRIDLSAFSPDFGLAILFYLQKNDDFKQHILKDNFIDLILFAYKHGLPELKAACVDRVEKVISEDMEETGEIQSQIKNRIEAIDDALADQLQDCFMAKSVNPLDDSSFKYFLRQAQKISYPRLKEACCHKALERMQPMSIEQASAFFYERIAPFLGQDFLSPVVTSFFHRHFSMDFYPEIMPFTINGRHLTINLQSTRQVDVRDLIHAFTYVHQSLKLLRHFHTLEFNLPFSEQHFKKNLHLLLDAIWRNRDLPKNVVFVVNHPSSQLKDMVPKYLSEWNMLRLGSLYEGWNFTVKEGP